MLETSSVSTGQGMTNREVMDLPVLGNNIDDAHALRARRSGPGTTQFLVQGQVGGGSGYNAAGGVGGNEWSIDGASTNGTDRRVSIMPSPDTVDEFKIETSNFDASFGHATGLDIRCPPSPGANEVHGTGTYQYFNQKWNAASFFVKQAGTRRLPRHAAAGRHRAGRPTCRPAHAAARTHEATIARTISGPVYIPRVIDGRNKLFFFFGYSELKNRQSARPSELNYTVPTEAMRNGDFSSLLAIESRSATRSTIRSPPGPIRRVQATGCVIHSRATLFLATGSITRCTISTRSGCRCRTTTLTAGSEPGEQLRRIRHAEHGGLRILNESCRLPGERTSIDSSCAG